MSDSDQQQWLTYAEAGKLLGVSAQAARMVAKRRGWPRRTPNAYGERALVLVPAEIVVRPRAASDADRTASVVTVERDTGNGHDRPPDQANVQLTEQALSLLRDQLDVANRRADAAEQRAAYAAERADRAERRIEQLQGDLSGALAKVDGLRAALAEAEIASAELRGRLARRKWWPFRRGVSR